MWTTALTLKGREFCAILNHFLRTDDAGTHAGPRTPDYYLPTYALECLALR